MSCTTQDNLQLINLRDENDASEKAVKFVEEENWSSEPRDCWRESRYKWAGGVFPWVFRNVSRQAYYLLSSLEKEAGVVASIRARVRCFKAASNSAWTFSIKPSRRWTSQARGNPGSTHSTCWNAFTALKHATERKDYSPGCLFKSCKKTFLIFQVFFQVKIIF